MQAPPAGNPGAIRSPARTRENKASVRPRSGYAVVWSHACYRRWLSRFGPNYQRSHHRHWSGDLRPCGRLENDQSVCGILRDHWICGTTRLYTPRGRYTLPGSASSRRSSAGRSDSPVASTSPDRSPCCSRSKPLASRRAYKIVIVDSSAVPSSSAATKQQKTSVCKSSEPNRIRQRSTAHWLTSNRNWRARDS